MSASGPSGPLVDRSDTLESIANLQLEFVKSTNFV